MEGGKSSQGTPPASRRGTLTVRDTVDQRPKYNVVSQSSNGMNQSRLLCLLWGLWRMGALGAQDSHSPCHPEQREMEKGKRGKGESGQCRGVMGVKGRDVAVVNADEGQFL